MLRKPLSRARKTRKSSQGKPTLDLSKVNPSGRLDVLAAKTLERFAQSRAPQLVPVIEEHKGVIHAELNERLGPHAIGVDLVGLMDVVRPYMPVLEEVAMGLITRYMQACKVQQAQQGVTE